MSGVFCCSDTNSTLFTECCRTATCDDESKCPGCGQEVPYTPKQRHDMAMRKCYGDAAVNKMHAKWDADKLLDDERFNEHLRARGFKATD